MTEQELYLSIRAQLDTRRLFYHHCTHPELCDGDPGFPDLVIAGPNGHLFAELKTAVGQPSPAQRAWGRMLNLGQHGRLVAPPYALIRPDTPYDAMLLDLARNPSV